MSLFVEKKFSSDRRATQKVRGLAATGVQTMTKDNLSRYIETFVVTWNQHVVWDGNRRKSVGCRLVTIRKLTTEFLNFKYS